MTFSGELTGHLAQIASVTGFSVGVQVQKDLVARYPPADILMLQFAASAAVMWIACAVLGILPKRLRDAVPGFFWGFLSPGFVFLFSSMGAERTDGVSVALIWGALPVIGPVAGRVLLGERFHWSLPFGAVIAFAGLVVLTLDRQAIGIGDPVGDLLVLAAVLTAACGQIVGRRLNTAGAHWFRLATLQVTGGLFLATVFARLDGEWTVPAADDTAAYIAFAYLVLGMTMVAFVGYNLALSRIQVAWVAFYSSLQPAIGTLAAVILLSAVVRPLDIAGLAIIVGGVASPHVLRIVRQRRGDAAGATGA